MRVQRFAGDGSSAAGWLSASAAGAERADDHLREMHPPILSAKAAAGALTAARPTAASAQSSSGIVHRARLRPGAPACIGVIRLLAKGIVRSAARDVVLGGRSS